MTTRKSPRVWQARLIALAAALLVAACSVEPQVTSGGCTKDDECRDGRRCVDRICGYPEDQSRRNAAQHMGEVLLRALAQGEPRIFASTWPDVQDYAWAFDFQAIAGDPTGEVLLAKRTQALTDDFTTLLYAGRDWSKVTFTRFVPGTSRPIVVGTEHARRNLEQLQDSRLYFSDPAAKGEQVLTISSLLLLRGRWRLFRLTPPALLPDGDANWR